MGFWGCLNFIEGLWSINLIVWRRMVKLQCAVCAEGGVEAKLVLTALRNRLSRLSHEYVPDFREEESGRGPTGFCRLLASIFGEASTLYSQPGACPHDKFSRYLRRKLKCDSPTFNDLCNQLVEQLAERAYQLELLCQQLRPISHRCLELAQLPANQRLLERMEGRKEERQTGVNLGRSEQEVGRERLTMFQLAVPSLLFSCAGGVSFVAFPQVGERLN